MQVTTTVSDAAQAKALSDKIIAGQLAACAQSHPIDSVYMWEGKVETAHEFRIIFKTLPRLKAEITEAIKSAHSYDVPQIIYTDITASDDYAAWVKSSVKR